MHYNFEWDPRKAKINIKKHGVSFEEVTEIFLDPFHLSVLDDEHSATIRVISARKATMREQREYEG